MKIIFFGTPEIAVPFLGELHRREEVVLAVTQPDRPALRGHHVHPPAVKVMAQERNIPVFQPDKFDETAVDMLKKLDADVEVVIAYGRLIPEKVFTLPRFGCFNIHFSLLPRYRGAAPIQWALINGEKETGVTTFWLEKTLDTGPVIVQKSLPISPEDDYPLLTQKLIPVAIAAMNETLERIRSGKCAGTPQSGEASYARPLTKDDGKIDWSKTAEQIVNLIKGTRPWPGSYAVIGSGKLQGKKLKILKADVAPDNPGEAVPGQVIDIIKNTGFAVKAGTGAVIVRDVHPENKGPITAWSFLQGNSLQKGDRFQ